MGNAARVIPDGSRFGQLTVVARVPGGSHPRYQCQCDCGELTVARGSHLFHGATKSCGCGRVKHGLLIGVHSGAPKPDGEASWRGIISRCNNPKDSSYKHYGARGIKVCARWRRLDLFLADMGPRPSPQHSVERIDVNGDYCPENCKWATPVEQGRNQRNNVLTQEKADMIRSLRAGGASYGQISRMLGVNASTVADAANYRSWA